MNYQPQLEQDFFHQQYFPNGPRCFHKKQKRIERSCFGNYLGLKIGHKWWYYRYYVIMCYLKCYQITQQKTICYCSHSDESLVVLATKSELMNWGASTPENPQPGSGCYIYWSSFLLVNYYQLGRLGILFLQKSPKQNISWSNDLSASTWDSVALITLTLDIFCPVKRVPCIKRESLIYPLSLPGFWTPPSRWVTSCHGWKAIS